MMRLLSVPFILFSFLAFPLFTYAYDINYASVEDIAGDTVLLRYRTTDDYTFATCSFAGECSDMLFGEHVGSNRPSLFPAIQNTTSYVTSPDGTIAVVNLAAFGGQVYRSLHRIDGQESTFLGLIPHREPASRTSVTYANDAVMFIGTNGVITRYDIDSGTVAHAGAGRASFPFWSSSEHGNVVAWYDHTTESQSAMNLQNGVTTHYPAGVGSYVVFDDSETRVAYLGEVQGFNKLFTAPLGRPELAREVSAGAYTAVEYEFIGDTLYYIANTSNNPYEWNLYSYVPATGEIEVVDRGVAYDDEYGNLKKTHSALLYEKVSGTHKDVVVYEPRDGSRTTLRAGDVRERELSDRINREALEIGNVPAVLLSPEDDGGDKPLIVWLHGGPMRQTSLEYHPFYGYAVYDEILERFAEEAYVLKLDYTGSWGHGNDFREALKNNIGDRDVKDVLGAVREMKDTYNISDTYLFGPSYGGYLSLRTLVEEPDEIEAVASIAGVTDWTSLITRIPSSVFTAQFSGVPNPLNMSQYATASVRDRLNAVDDQEMLLIYGADDATVPVWQSTEFYSFASGMNKNVDLVRYEGEAHTIVKRDNLVDVCERVAEVFNLSESLCRD